MNETTGPTNSSKEEAKTTHKQQQPNIIIYWLVVGHFLDLWKALSRATASNIKCELN